MAPAILMQKLTLQLQDGNGLFIIQKCKEKGIS